MAEEENNNRGQAEEEKPGALSNTYGSLDRKILVHFFTVFSFSFFMGILIIHTSLLWHSYQTMSGQEDGQGIYSGLLGDYGISGYHYNKPIEIRANTSLFVR